MKLRILCLASCLVASASAAALQGPDAKELELKEQPSEHEQPTPVVEEPSFPEPKYFQEWPEGSHYDARYTKAVLSEKEQKAAIKILIQTYLATFRELKVQTWLMHGSLLGWWWGKQVMPWDYDADVQITEADMYFLAAYYNMTEYYYKYGNMEKGRFFLLDVNPYFKYRNLDDALNLIDARWIDMETGLFIDITAARYHPNHPEGEGMMYDKHDHEYRDTFLFPLRETTFEGVPALIPFRYKEMLVSEYGEKALRRTVYKDHEFDKEKMRWVPDADR